MKGKRYYLTIMNGEDACILCGPADISEIDLITMFISKENFLDLLLAKYNLNVPDDSDICIIQLKVDKDNLEYLQIYDPIFETEANTYTQYKLASIFPSFTMHRVNSILNHQSKLSIENASSVDFEGEKVGFQDFVLSFLKDITSSSKRKEEFLNQSKLLRNHVKKYLCTPDPLETFNLEKILNDLKQYKDIRAIYLEYLNFTNQNIDFIKKRRVGYYYPFKKALKEYKEERLKAIIKTNTYEDSCEELLEEFERGIISWEEFLERTEYINKGKDIGYYR